MHTRDPSPPGKHSVINQDAFAVPGSWHRLAHAPRPFLDLTERPPAPRSAPYRRDNDPPCTSETTAYPGFGFGYSNGSLIVRVSSRPSSRRSTWYPRRRTQARATESTGITNGRTEGFNLKAKLCTLPAFGRADVLSGAAF